MFIGKNEDDTDPIYESYDKVYFIDRILLSGIDFLLSWTCLYVFENIAINRFYKITKYTKMKIIK